MKKTVNKTVALMPFTEIVNTGKDNSKVIAIKQTGLNKDVFVEVEISLDGENSFPIVNSDSEPGLFHNPITMFRVKADRTTSGIIIKDCPTPYIHLKFKNSEGATSGTIQDITFE